MDPLSAFALAGTVYTFIDAGITVTKFAKELSEFWKSSRETMESVGHLTITTQNLQALSSELLNVDEPLYMQTIAAECAALCQELSGLLDKLRVKDKKSKTQHFSVMVSAYRRKDKISSIEDRLGKLRAQMTLDLLRSLNHGQSDIKKMLDAMQFDIGKLSSTHYENFRQRRSELFDLLQACEKDEPQDHSVIIRKLRDFQSEVSHETIQNQILQALRFDGMYSREDNTSEATEGTFRWLLIKNRRFEKRYVRNNKTIDKMQVTREAFLTWLESGEGVFHVCGKAGSGKSTLMKFICTNSRTRNGLNTWAGDDTLLHASFFFFAPGEKEAKSLTGLYRCLLFTILNEHRDLMSKIYPDEFLSDRQSSPQFLNLLRPQRLEKAVQSLIDTAATGAYKMCIFIDGLDEYEGSFTDYWQLADRLLGWADQSSGRVKFCVSSRPEVQFVKTFGSENVRSIRQIHLQEFTRGDIEKHCQDQFAKSSWFEGSDTVPNYDKFVDHIVGRAEGVFLWAVLVTKVLLYETRKDGFERDLWRRLEEIPDDINALYDRLFDYMGKEQRRKCNLILLAILTNPFPEPLNARSLNLIYDEEDLDQALLKQHDDNQYVDHKREEGRVTDNLGEWTRGLVEAITWEQAVVHRGTRNENSSASRTNEDYTSQDSGSERGTGHEYRVRTEDIFRNRLGESPLFRTRVRLFHKTVRDYILSSTNFRKLHLDFSKLDGIHAKLRLLELGPVGHAMPNSWPPEICDYIYEILEKNVGVSVNSNKQIPWSICKAIGSLMPFHAKFELRDLMPFLDPSSSSFYNGRSKWSHDYVGGEISLAHFAAFFGHPEALEEAQCGSRSSRGSIKDNVPTPNLLLSACLGRIVNSGISVDAGTGNIGIITKVLDLGYSGRDHIRVTSKGRIQSVTVWELLICALSLVNPQSSLHVPSSVNQLLRILAQLLESGTQKEVLVLLYSWEDWENSCATKEADSLGDSDCGSTTLVFSSFITVQDIVESFDQSDSRDSLLCQLKDGPQSKSAKPPAWLHALFETPLSHDFKALKDIRRLSPNEYSQWRKDCKRSMLYTFAVVSNDVFLEGRLSGGYGGVPLW